MSWPPFNGDMKTADDVGPVRSGVAQHRNDASHVIAGAEIVMCRFEANASVRRCLGADVGRVSIVDHWQEQLPKGMSPLCLTLIHHPLRRGEYAVIVWGMDEMIRDACLRVNLEPGLAMVVYAIGALDSPKVLDVERARACCLELARMVAKADLPWPPEDEQDHDVWRRTAALIDGRATAA